MCGVAVETGEVPHALRTAEGEVEASLPCSLTFSETGQENGSGVIVCRSKLGQVLPADTHPAFTELVEGPSRRHTLRPYFPARASVFLSNLPPVFPEAVTRRPVQLTLPAVHWYRPAFQEER